MASETNHESRLEFSIGAMAKIDDQTLFDLPPSDDLLPGAIRFIDLASDEPLPEFPDDAALHPPATYDPPVGHSTTEDTSSRSLGEIWLDGNVLMCPCPDCRAPMSIRLWLMIADCWRCGTSIELTEEQEREAMRLLEEREKKLREERAHPKVDGQLRPANTAVRPQPTQPETPKPQPTAPSQQSPPAPRQPQSANVQSPAPPSADAAAIATPPPAPPAERRREQPAPRRATSPQAKPTGAPTPGAAPQRWAGQSRFATPPATIPQRLPAAAAPAPARRRIQQQATVASVAHAWLRSLFRDTPAWLVSLVFHLVMLTLLAMLGPEDEGGERITLALNLSSNVREGGEKVVLDSTDNLQFDLPIPENIDVDNPEERKAMVRADQEARELRIDPNSVNPQMPDLSRVKAAIGTNSSPQAALAARDPRVRVEMVQREGGTTMTEAAVARALRWLAEQQKSDGHWDLDGGMRSDMAGTSLALLPFLGAGQSHTVGRYQETVAKGLRWMVDHQKPNGDLRYNCGGNSGMYAHGQGAIVLCEAFLMSGDEELRVPAQRAIDFIVKAQHIGGGWRYEPNSPGDTSVVGWQLMALQSARAAGLTTPETTFELASHYLDSVQSHGGSRYAYMPRQGPTHVMTAEALLCRVYLGWKKDNPGLGEGINFLADSYMPRESDPNIYYWYYATQAFHHFGGDEWERWNMRMRDILVDTQETSGKNAGSWQARGPHSNEGGRIYMTALATCTLEVYYRHLPIFRQIDLD